MRADAGASVIRRRPRRRIRKKQQFPEVLEPADRKHRL